MFKPILIAVLLTLAFSGQELANNQFLVQGQMISSPNCYHAVFQKDGDFVLYRTRDFKPSNVMWQTRTKQNLKGGKLIMQNDGNLVIYKAAGTPFQ